jgi:hypothetical protein
MKSEFSNSCCQGVLSNSPKKSLRTLVCEQFWRFRAKQKALEMLVSSILKALPVELNGLRVFAIQDEVRQYGRITFRLFTTF